MSRRQPGIPATLVRLKIRLLANRARRSSSGAVQLVLALVVATLFGGMLGFGGFVLGTTAQQDIADPLLVISATAVSLGWMLFPLLTFGTDEALDPARLVLFPLRRRPLMAGLLMASTVGPAPFGVILALTITAVGYGVSGGGLVVIPAMVLLVSFSVALARTVTTVLASSLTSRRGRDATMIVAALMGVAVQGIRFISFEDIDPATLDGVRAVLRWTPPGMLAQAVVDARSGRALLAFAELVPPAVLILGLLWVWSKALDRSMTVVASGSGSKRRRPTGELPLIPAWLPVLGRHPWGAVAARELRYMWREPRHKVQLVNAVVLGGAVPLWLAVRAGDGLGARTVLLATIGAYLVVLGSSNQFGFDGAAMWIDLVAGDTARTTIVGKNVAALALTLPIVGVIGLAVAAITGGWIYLPAALLLAVAGLGAGLGTANVVSVRFPIRLPDNRSPFASGGGGQGCSRSGVLMVCLMVQNLLLLPVVIAGGVAAVAGPLWLTALVPAALVYGAVLWWIGTGMAVRRAQSNGAELLALVDPRRET